MKSIESKNNQYKVSKKDIKNINRDDFSRMFTLVEKYLKNKKMRSNDLQNQKVSLISDEELLELAATLPAYTNMYNYENITPPVYTISEDEQDDCRFTAGYFNSDNGQISLTRKFVDKIKNGEFSFQEFANTVYHENQHFLNKYFIDNTNKNSKFTQLSERMYDKLLDANANYASSKKLAELAMNTYIIETGKDRLYFSDEFKTIVEKLRTLNKLDSSFEARCASVQYPEYNDVAVDLKNANEFVLDKLKKNPEFITELKQAGIKVDDKNIEINDFSDLFSNGFVAKIIDAFENEPKMFGYKFADAEHLGFCVYSMNDDELSARRNSTLMQTRMFEQLLKENFDEETLNLLRHEFTNEFARESLRELNETKSYKRFIENFNENVKAYLDNYEGSTIERNYNNRILQEYATKNSSISENFERLKNGMINGKGDYLYLIANELSISQYLEEKELERTNGLKSLFETLKAGELGNIDEKLVNSFVSMFGRDKMFELGKLYGAQGKTVYNAKFLNEIINSKQEIMPADELLPELVESTIVNNKKIDEMVLPELYSLAQKYKNDLTIIQRKSNLSADDFSHALDIKNSVKLFAFNSKIEDENLKREMRDVMSIAFNTMNKYSGYFSKDELDFAEKDIMQKYNIDMSDKNFQLLIEAHANLYIASSIEFVEKRKYGKAYAKSMRKGRMEKFLECKENAVNNLAQRQAMQDGDEHAQ